MKKRARLLILCLLSMQLHTKAQLAITDSLSAADVSNLLTGFGVNISNLSMNCDPRAIAEFNGSSEVPITQGLLLCTGYADNLLGPNNNQQSTGITGYPGDADLDSMINWLTTYDACVVEFDCEPQGDTLLFNFAFGSEEYPEFVGTFNDAFAILISGPGINGTQNIAHLPNGDIVSINNVNDSINSAYYYDNTNPPGVFTQYDGFTQNLEVFAVTYPDSVYHFKIVIADHMDQVFDSGVMLEAFSFRSVPELVTGTEQKRVSSFTAWPNPANGNLTISYAESTGELRLIDLSGRKVLESKLSKGNNTLSLQGVDPGQYLLMVNSSSGISTQIISVK